MGQCNSHNKPEAAHREMHDACIVRQPYFHTSELHLGISFTHLPILEPYLRILVRPRSRALVFRCSKNRNSGKDVMTNTSERATAQVLGNTSERVTAKVFGLSLTAVFVGLLILNGISF